MKTVPEGYHVVTPWIIAKGAADLIVFLTKAFDAKETEGSRITTEDGSIGHVEVKIGDSTVLAFDAKPDWPDTPSFLRLYVKDGDTTYRRAIEAGAASITKMTDLAFGDRVGRVKDRWGNVWWIHQHLEDVAPEEMMKRMKDPAALEAMRYVEQSLGEAFKRR